jgi:hypothetical protein
MSMRAAARKHACAALTLEEKVGSARAPSTNGSAHAPAPRSVRVIQIASDSTRPTTPRQHTSNARGTPILQYPNRSHPLLHGSRAKARVACSGSDAPRGAVQPSAPVREPGTKNSVGSDSVTVYRFVPVRGERDLLESAFHNQNSGEKTMNDDSNFSHRFAVGSRSL